MIGSMMLLISAYATDTGPDCEEPGREEAEPHLLRLEWVDAASGRVRVRANTYATWTYRLEYRLNHRGDDTFWVGDLPALDPGEEMELTLVVPALVAMSQSQRWELQHLTVNLTGVQDGKVMDQHGIRSLVVFPDAASVRYVSTAEASSNAVNGVLTSVPGAPPQIQFEEDEPTFEVSRGGDE